VTNNMVIIPQPLYLMNLAPSPWFHCFQNLKWTLMDNILKQCLTATMNSKQYMTALWNMSFWSVEKTMWLHILPQGDHFEGYGSQIWVS
jgi:hypothetical protein